MAVSTTSSRVSFCLFSSADGAELTLKSGDTILHSWEILAKILINPDCRDIVCDIGMYVNTYWVEQLDFRLTTSLILQANDAQEQQLQLPSDHLQWKDLVDPAQDVDGKRWKLRK